jgi:hypothetical protein
VNDESGRLEGYTHRGVKHPDRALAAITSGVEYGIMRDFFTQAITERMPVSPTLLLIVYCLAITGFSLLGGWLPSRVKMTHTRTQLVMSLVSGLMLGVAFYHLLPHSIAMIGGTSGADIAVWWLMLGLILMLLLLRVFHFHIDAVVRRQ